MELKTQTSFFMNMGPQHPSTHGVFRMRLQVDGEVIQEMEPVFGYLHRGIEKLGEERTYTQIIPLTDRLDYTSAMNNNLAYCMAVEKLAGIAVPEKAQYIRVIVAELQRIAAHLLGVGALFNDVGCMATPLLYMFREREKILDMFEMVCGQRLTTNYVRVGGVAQDLPEDFLPILKVFCDDMPSKVDEYEMLLSENEVVVSRLKGVGVLPADLAINASVSGPVLRASGIKWDIRRADPYLIYDRIDFEIPTGAIGDCYDRYIVRLKEIRQCVRILKQAMEQIPAGEVKADVPAVLRPPKGEAYARIESPKGELGFFLVSDESINPYRFHIRAPAFINLTPLRDMIMGWKVADVVVTLGSIDICMGEVDR